MTKALLVCFIAIASTLGNAQQPDASVAPRASQPTTIIWKAGAPNCDLKYKDGVAMKSISDENYWVSASMSEHWGKTTASVAVLVDYKAAQRVLFSAENVSLFSVEKGRMVEVKRADPDKMVRSTRRRMAIASGLSTMGAGMQTSTATATTSDGERITVTMPNYEAQRQAREQVGSNRTFVDTMDDDLERRALKKNTLSANDSVVGNVYFDRQKKGTIVLRIELGRTVFEIPFDAKTHE